ncbi:hypothetical protein ACFJGV_17265 [Cnuibacter sp. UC19_7]|uniref:hypothetical protein n=1 Tax=Cnuibacter sp. UC19_7 TaxID=3350166 RepID=UPI00366FB6CA
MSTTRTDAERGPLSSHLEVTRAGPAAIGWQRARFRLDRSLSGGYLGIGFVILGSLLMVRGLSSLGWSWSGSPWRVLSVVSWLILAVVLVVVVVSSRRRAGLVSPTVSILVDTAGVAAVLIDLTALLLDAASGDGSATFYPTATVGFGACLLASLPAQPLSRSAFGGVLLVIVGGAGVAVGWLVDPASVPVSVNNLVIGAAPVFAFMLMLSATDARLGVLIDQAVADSLIPAPPTGHGVSAASHLRTLDDEAEQLLDRVASAPPGTDIDPATAALAGALGDELRAALRADHELSWLQIAISESERLSGAVVLDDDAAAVKRLAADQRSTLLALVWLLSALRSAAPSPAAATALDVRVEPAAPGDDTALIITLSRPGTRAQSIDNAAWPLFTRLGRYTIDVTADRVAVAVHVLLPRTRVTATA